MSKMSADCSLKSLTSMASNELLQSNNNLTFKLLKTVVEFSQTLATLHDKFGHELQMLVETFRKRNGELRKERLNCPNSLFQIWELLLQQVEVNSQQHGDISRSLSHSIGNGLMERILHRKIQAKKIFSHRDKIEQILLKSNELLHKCYDDYCQAYSMALSNPANHMSDYVASHNVYVHQLQATNGMIHAYQTKTLPNLLEELEECQLETSGCMSTSLLESSEFVSEKSSEQASSFQLVAGACRQANHRQDLAHFVKAAQADSSGDGASANSAGSSADTAGDRAAAKPGLELRYHHFQTPALAGNQQVEPKNMQLVPTFKNEIAPDSLGGHQKPQLLDVDRQKLEEKIEKLDERIDLLAKALNRSIESKLFNKANEIQEELSQKRFELQVANIHLSALRAQLQLFDYHFAKPSHGAATLAASLRVQQPASDSPAMTSGASVYQLDPSSAGAAGSGNQDASGGAQGSSGYKGKWIKAFKSLRESPVPMAMSQQQQQLQLQQQALVDGQDADEANKENSQTTENMHFFQEYTFKKIASCDVCKDFLRGHLRQGVKCKLCKISSHNECQAKANATIKCQQPKIKLLRRQKSAGELELNATADNPDNSSSANHSSAINQAAHDTSGERSKADGMFQIIRTILDAKKRSQQPQQAQQAQQAQQGYLDPFGGPMGASNLASMNQNGKSVSTSALGSATIDRWAVVMDLLEESRRREKEAKAAAEGAPAAMKRHSKQLDMFKMAAKSAAAASKHQRVMSSRQQQQQAQSQPQPQRHHREAGSPLQGQPEQQPEPSHQHLGSQHLGPQHQQQLHQQQPQQAQSELHQPLHLQPYQLLNVAQSQLNIQSTSAPHSPQQRNRRFQLRMKSFSLDSPENSTGQAPAAPDSQQHHAHHQLHHQQQHPSHHLQLHGQQQQQQPSTAPYSSYNQQYDYRPEATFQQTQHLFGQPHDTPSYHHRHSYQLNQPVDYHNQQQQHQEANSDQSLHHQSDHPLLMSQHQHQLSSSHNAINQIHLSSVAQSQANKQQQQRRQLPSNSGQQYDPVAVNQQQQPYHGQKQQQNQQQQATNKTPLSLNMNFNLKHQNQNPNQNQNHNQNSISNHNPNQSNDMYPYDTMSTLGHHAQAGMAMMQPYQPSGMSPGGNHVVLYEYTAQRPDELSLTAGQLVALMEPSEPDWWKVRLLDGSQRVGYFPSSYLAQVYPGERPMQVLQTIQVSNGDICDKLLRGQIVVHTGKQIDSFVTIRTIGADSLNQNDLQFHYIKCPEKYLADLGPK